VTAYQGDAGQVPYITLAKARPCNAGRQACTQADSLRHVICKPIRVGIYDSLRSGKVASQ